MPEGDDAARRAKAFAMADAMAAGQTIGIEGREQEYLEAMTVVLRTFQHNQGYPHQVNDALVKTWVSGVRFALRHDLLDAYVADSVEVLSPVLERVRGLIEVTGRRDLALEAIAGWSTDHFQLVITPTHVEPGRRWFVSPFGRVVEAMARLGQLDFDETFVVEQFFLPRARGFGDAMGVPVGTAWDPETRVITLTIDDAAG